MGQRRRARPVPGRRAGSGMGRQQRRRGQHGRERGDHQQPSTCGAATTVGDGADHGDLGLDTGGAVQRGSRCSDAPGCPAGSRCGCRTRSPTRTCRGPLQERRAACCRSGPDRRCAPRRGRRPRAAGSGLRPRRRRRPRWGWPGSPARRPRPRVAGPERRAAATRAARGPAAARGGPPAAGPRAHRHRGRRSRRCCSRAARPEAVRAHRQAGARRPALARGSAVRADHRPVPEPD